MRTVELKKRAQMSKQKPEKEDQLHSLLEAVERLRKDCFPHLDGQLVKDILRLHADPGFADTELARNVEQAVERRLRGEK